MSGSSVTATRVTLRPLNDGAAPPMMPWLPEAVAAVDGVKPDGDTPATLDGFARWAAGRWPGARQDAVCVDGAAAGFLVWHASAAYSLPHLQIVALAVRRDLRNLGYGLEAVMALEAAHTHATPYATIPRSNGLAVYFWLRAGYRPVWLDESRELATDQERLWMVRGDGNLTPRPPSPQGKGVYLVRPGLRKARAPSPWKGEGWGEGG